MFNHKFLRLLFLVGMILCIPFQLFAAEGDHLPGMTPTELAQFFAGKTAFEEEDFAGPTGDGLGPRFNALSCVECHSHPAAGGTSPPVNPQIVAATKFGARNKIPFFIRENGPVREARFPFFPDGRRDGGVTDLFVITGRSDAPGCNIDQIEFDRRRKVIFRIPTPLFGSGLLEAIADADILANMNSNLRRKRELGIRGHENRSESDGTVTRFGWKAQHASLINFSGEAYNVEIGITNELFPHKRDGGELCEYLTQPEDRTDFDAPNPIAGMSDVIAFREFMRFLAPPEPLPPTPSSSNGHLLFSSIGCDLCHTENFITNKTESMALRNKPVHPFSDLILHHMGKRLEDNIIQAKAGPDEFRTAPLWGIGKRLFFLHDGRTNDLHEAIESHRSEGSEANKVTEKYSRLSSRDQHDIIEFLKSL